MRQFEGNHSFSKSELLKVMPKTAETGFLKDAPFVLEEVQRDVVQLNRFYQSEGFLDAKATLLGWTPSADFTRVTIRIGIEEGEPYFVRSIRIEGMTRFDPEQVPAKMQTKVGCRYRPGVELARDMPRTSTKMYENCAYLQVDVRDASTIDVECNQVDVVIRVAEGEVNLVGEVDHRGQPRDEGQRASGARSSSTPESRSRKRAVRAGEARHRPARLLGAVADRRHRRLRRHPERPLRRRGARAYVSLRDTKRENIKDVVVTVKERDTGSLRFAVGVGSNTGLIGDITYQKDNFDPFDSPSASATSSTPSPAAASG